MTALFDAMRERAVERLRFRPADPGGRRVLGARRDEAWQDAGALLPERESDLAWVVQAVAAGGAERLDLVYREEIGLRFLCAVHSTARGPGAGGLRRRDLITPESEVILDALDLARAMTFKNAVADVPRGGSKLVVHGSPLPEYEREKWIRILAEEIDLSGTITGPDVGFAAGVYLDLARVSTNVSGVRDGGTGRSAAFGVGLALRAVLAALGLPINEARIVVQGLGTLGTELAVPLAQEGARLVVTDLDHRRIDAFLSGMLPEQRRQIDVIAPYQVFDSAADVLAPCAIGGILTERNTGALKVRAVCGGANNQLHAHSLAGELALARSLRDAGVLFVPDWLASAGGTIHGTMEAAEGDAFDLRRCRARIRRTCGWLVDEILEDAKRSGRTPMEIAADRFQLGS